MKTKILSLIFLIISLSACVNPHIDKTKLPTDKTIGVYSALGNRAQIFYNGITAFTNNSALVSLPNAHIDQLLTYETVNALKQHGYRAIPISRAQYPLPADPMHVRSLISGHFNYHMRNWAASTAKANHVYALIVILPAYLPDDSSGYYDAGTNTYVTTGRSTPASVYGYGVLKHKALIGSGVQSYISYSIYVYTPYLSDPYLSNVGALQYQKYEGELWTKDKANVHLTPQQKAYLTKDLRQQFSALQKYKVQEIFG